MDKYDVRPDTISFNTCIKGEYAGMNTLIVSSIYLLKLIQLPCTIHSMV